MILSIWVKSDNNVLDLVKQKGFYPYEQVPNKEKFYRSLTGKKN